MENRGYFFIDGSRLLSSIFEIWRIKPALKGKKINIGSLTESLTRRWSIYTGVTVRITYYFKQNDERLKNMVVIPESDIPGSKSHWQIKECGQNIRKAIPDEELQKISPEYRDHFIRSEKGLDIRLTCDSLTLVATNRASNIVFLVNDRDYIPLFEAIQQLGGNAYLTALYGELNIQKGLANLSDMYLTLDDELENIFGIVKTEEKKPEQTI